MAKELGLPVTDDCNRPHPKAYALSDHCKEWERWSDTDAFLKPTLSRNNVTLLKNCIVERIVMEGRSAVGAGSSRHQLLLQGHQPTLNSMLSPWSGKALHGALFADPPRTFASQPQSMRRLLAVAGRARPAGSAALPESGHLYDRSSRQAADGSGNPRAGTQVPCLADVA
ncbi:MAG: GMC family oxidoreductase N-terminal domain-containing protein [Rhizobiales bacterium]|nr:GMC family oxidoreductase N-terminal domain-containing protein [Hyphomicrobiales bacterium]